MRAAVFIYWLLPLTMVLGLELVVPPTVELSPSNAVVRWRTDVASGTHARITPANAKVTVPDKSPSSEHLVLVTGFQPGVSYSIVVGSARAWLATNTFTSTGVIKTAAVDAAATEKKPAVQASETLKAPPARKIWANWSSLPDHFARHGGDFRARDAEDYARMSWEFLQRAKAADLPAKVDAEGVLRVFDSKSGTFAAYNRDGTTKTFFKPGSRDYFERQPGQAASLKTWKAK